MFPIPTFLYKWIAIAVVVLAALGFTGYKAYNAGVDHQKAVVAAAIEKSNKEVVKKNEVVQSAADKEATTQVIYKDKIITKYQTITKEVIKYEQTPAASTGLDAEFVRLHNDAATRYDALQITQSTSGTDGQTPITGVTTGEAIGVISRNYERYYQCVRQVEGWQRFYTDLQKSVNK